MAQERYHNYNRPLQSLPENYRMAGLIMAGVYAGFDTFEIVAGNILRIKHNVTGLSRLNAAADGNEGPFGVFSTRQGIIIYDDEEMELGVDLAVTNPRIDLLVVNHTHLNSPGGSAATYSIVKGAEAVSPVAPAIPLPLSQVKLGHFIVYPGADHTNTIFVRSDARKLGGQYAFMKATEEELAVAPEKDFNKIQRSGVYFMDNVTTNRPSTETPYWTLFVFKKGDKLVQFAMGHQSGKAFTRAALTWTGPNVATWGSWVNLNNPDVPAVDLSPIIAAIGTRTYTEQNYVTNGQSLTLSVDALDIALKAIDIILDQAVIDIDNLESAVGTRSYSENNILTDSESVTASLEKLDKSWGKADTGEDLNTFIQPGVYGTFGTATNAPSGAASGYMVVQKTFLSPNTTIHQWYHDTSGHVWRRTDVQNNGASWNAWQQLKFGEHTVAPVGTWDMDVTASISFAHSVTLGTDRIREVFVKVINNAGNLAHDLSGPDGDVRWDDTNIIVTRRAGGMFDAAGYNAAMVFARVKWFTIP